MLDQDILFNVVATTAAFLGLWVLFHWQYAQYRKDLLQNRLFAVRQDLFDLARSGVIAFDHPAYGLLRTTINGFIRFGGRMNLLGLVVLILTTSAADKRFRSENYTARLDRLSQDLPEDVRRRLEGLRMRFNVAILCHVVFTSLPLAILFWPLALLARSISWERIVPRFDRVDDAALEIGSGGPALDPSYQPV